MDALAFRHGSGRSCACGCGSCGVERLEPESLFASSSDSFLHVDGSARTLAEFTSDAVRDFGNRIFEVRSEDHDRGSSWVLAGYFRTVQFEGWVALHAELPVEV